VRRREALGVLAGLAAWPGAAGAQQRAKPVVGVLVLTDASGFLALLRAGLRDLGYAEGHNRHLEVRSGEGDASRLPALAAELVAGHVDVLVAYPTPAAAAAKRATADIPTVIVAPDPVADGLVGSLVRPGGNITGLSLSTAELSAKSLDLVREMLPAARRLGVLANATDPFTATFLREVQGAAASAGMEAITSLVQMPNAVADGLSELKHAQADVVLVQGSLVSPESAAAALDQRLPTVSPRKTFATAGGLVSYGADLTDTYRNAALYVDKVLKGTKPADLPVTQPTRFELVINMRTAKALGIAVPASLLARADEVIE
jgi:putative tryptophan/tyrosine transport system substrate-binding protein